VPYPLLARRGKIPLSLDRAPIELRRGIANTLLQVECFYSSFKWAGSSRPGRTPPSFVRCKRPTFDESPALENGTQALAVNERGPFCFAQLFQLENLVVDVVPQNPHIDLVRARQVQKIVDS